MGQAFVDVQRTKNIYTIKYNPDCKFNPSSCEVNQYLIPNCKINIVRPEITIIDGNGVGFNSIYTALMSVDMYYTDIVPIYLDRKEEYTYDQVSGAAILQNTDYIYGNVNHMMPTRIETVNSSNKSISKKMKYPQDLAAPNGSTPNIYNEMVSKNMLDYVVNTKVNNVTDNKILSEVTTDYQKWNGLTIQPALVSSSVFNNALATDISFKEYDSKGNITKYLTKDGIYKSYIWGYNKSHPIAEMISSSNMVALYTSFEQEEVGGWSPALGSSILNNNTGVTGTASFSGTLTKTFLQTGDYVVTMWSRPSGSVVVNGNAGQLITNTSFNGWKLYKWTLLNITSITIIADEIDEVRAYPIDARMTTYTFDPLLGMTSQCDANNVITFFEYDGFSRLRAIRDSKKNIVKLYEYSYSVPVPGSSCGDNCTVLAMLTFNGTNTIGYPLGVFNVNGKLLGNAVDQIDFKNKWNNDAANQAIGTLEAGSDPLYFNLTVNTGATIPKGVTGCRYYQFDLPYTSIDGIRRLNAVYIDFGDGTGMPLGKSETDNTGVILAPNTIEHNVGSPYYYFTHNYANDSLKTLTFYHNEEESPALDNVFVPATSLMLLRNFKGTYPQNAVIIGGSSYQQPSAQTVANIVNWNSISNIKVVSFHNGDSQNPSLNLDYSQDFMANNRGLERIHTAHYGPDRTGYRDLTFKISRLKTDWNTYFSQLTELRIKDEHWDREDLSALKHLNLVYWFASRQNYQDGPGNPFIPIPSLALDNFLGQISTGAGQTVTNGLIRIVSGGTTRTNASDIAVNHLKSKGWTITIDGVAQ
ncbi:hypothetical protein [Flavitalea sp.]|nr:hypothetical protein [Flavitalea sp.]